MFRIGVVLAVATASLAYEYNETQAAGALNIAAAAYPTDDKSRYSCLSLTYPGSQFRIVASATSPCDSKGNMCQAFAALSTTDKKLVFSFRGTSGILQLLQEIDESLRKYVDYNEMDPNNNTVYVGSANKYFLEAARDLWPQIVEPALNDAGLTDLHNYEILVTGHSLGGSLAALTAFKLGYTYGDRIGPGKLSMISFGEPRTGDSLFAQTFQQYVPRAFRVVHYRDPISQVPFLAGEKVRQNKGEPYHHTQEIWYDADFKVPTLCSTTNGEDTSCSDQFNFINDAFHAESMHLHYFNHYISQFGDHGCSASGLSLAVVFALVTVYLFGF